MHNYSSYTSCNVSGWIEVAGVKIMYSKVEQSCDDKPKLSLTLVVYQDFSWRVQISGHAHHLTTTSCSLSSSPSTISSTWDVQAILYFLNTCAICKGNSDQKFADLAAKRKGVFWSASECFRCYNKTANTFMCKAHTCTAIYV